MSTLLVLTSTLAFLCPVVLAQGTFTYDQQSATDGQFGEVAPLIPRDGPAQSFTPSLNGVAFIRLYLTDGFPGDTLSTTMYLNLRQDSPIGTILSTSSPVTLRGYTDGGAINFFFPTTVPVTPGQQYYFDPQLQTGSSTWSVSGSRLFNYSGGTAYSQGVPATGVDLWFREGIVVPEPSTFALLVVGAVTIACLRHRKSR